MTLRSITPINIEKRLKALFYGKAGTGKTFCAIQFPKPYLIDTEKGAENDQYVKRLQQSEGVIFQTNDFDELLTEVKSLLSEKHTYKTLIIDPLTIIYNDLIDKESLRIGTDFGRHIVAANKRMKALNNLLMKLDMNVIITAHAKNEYGNNMALLGTTFDCFKGADHFFDIVFEIQKRGKNYVSMIKKSRLDAFSEGEVIDFNYENISRLYGRNMLEKDSEQKELATSQQVTELLRLINLLKIPEEIYQKWLKREDIESFDFMSSINILKCTDYCQSKIKGE